MATNYRILSEEIARLYARGIQRENVRPTIDFREIRPKIAKAINRLIKAETMARNEAVGTVLATYSLPVTDGKAELTVYPISLPKEQGIHRVYPEDCPWKPYVPIRSGDFDIVQGIPSQYIEGNIGYWQDGKNIVFTRDPKRETVGVKLVVHDPSQVSDTDVLPIPPEMEADVIEMVLQMFGDPSRELQAEQLNPRTQ